MCQVGKTSITKKKHKTILILMCLTVCFISFMLGCQTNNETTLDTNKKEITQTSSTEKIANAPKDIKEELIETLKKLSEKADAGDVEGAERFFDVPFIEMYKKHALKKGVPWDSTLIKTFNTMNDIKNCEILGVTTKGRWARLEMKCAPSQLSKIGHLETIVFGKIGDEWKIFNRVMFAHDMNRPIDNIIQENAYIDAYIPPVTQAKATDYVKTPISQLAANKTNNSLQGKYIETRGTLVIKTIENTTIASLEANSPEDLKLNPSGYMVLTIKEELFPNFDKIVSQCNKKCNATVKGILDGSNIIVTKIEIQ